MSDRQDKIEKVSDIVIGKVLEYEKKNLNTNEKNFTQMTDLVKKIIENEVRKVMGE